MKMGTTFSLFLYDIESYITSQLPKLLRLAMQPTPRGCQSSDLAWMGSPKRHSPPRSSKHYQFCPPHESVERSDDRATTKGESCPMVGNESNEKSPCPGTGSREGIVAESIFRVLLVNDDATPMEFVVKVLVDVFQKTHAEAVRIMFTTHHMGKGTCGVYTRPDAERLVDRVAALAHRNKHPLRCVMEPDALEEPITCDIPVALKESHVLTQQGSLGDLPSIVLEAGGGCPRQGWALVQERLARRSLVVSYDRAGLGWNTEWPYDVSAAGVATRLATLLVRAAIPSPHLLVGHSLGGLFIQYYAAKHPREVAGLVLVDPTPADRSHDCGERLFAPGGLLWDPFSTRGRELAALSTTLLLVHRHPIPPEMPVL